MSEWRYIAQRLNGDGTATMLHTDLPLTDVEITDTLSGPARITGKIPFPVASMVGVDGRPLLREWSTAIYAEENGNIAGGSIFVNGDFSGPEMSLDCAGFSAYPIDQPFTDSWFGVEIDPLDCARKIWDHLQSQPGGNLGLEVDRTKSNLRIGDKLNQVEFDTQSGPVSFEAGPYKLAWWLTDDLGKEFDDLAAKTPFDYHEEHWWDGDNIRHRLRIEYPRIGRRRDDLRFVLGENIGIIPDVKDDGDNYANSVLVLGAGEGRDMIRGSAAVPDNRLRRVAVVADSGIRSVGDANGRAGREVNFRLQMGQLASVTVRDHRNAPMGSWIVGDEILIEGSPGWMELDQWVRVVSMSRKPADPATATLTLLRPTTVPPTQLKVVSIV